MGGRGGKSRLKGGIGRTKEQDVKLDLSTYPRLHTANDKGLSGVLRQQVEKFEDGHRFDEFEHSYVTDANGNILESRTGNSRGVRISPDVLSKAAVVSHNHPREGGVFGGAFSKADVRVFTSHDNIKTMRATAKEGTYSMSKGKNYNRAGFESEVGTAFAKNQRHFNKMAMQINKRYTDPIEAHTRTEDAFNTMLQSNFRAMKSAGAHNGVSVKLEKSGLWETNGQTPKK